MTGSQNKKHVNEAHQHANEQESGRGTTPANTQKPRSPKNINVGQLLKRTREHYGKTLEDVEYALRIRASQIQAIEDNDAEKLPGRVYAIGFVRSYAEYLDLDGDKVVALFKRQNKVQAAQPSYDFPVNSVKSRRPPWWLVAVCICIIASAFVFWIVPRSHQNAKSAESIPSVAEALQNDADIIAKNNVTLGESDIYGPQQPTTAMTSNDASLQETPSDTQSAPMRKGTVLNVTQNTWVEIKNTDGEMVLSKILKAGDKYYVPHRPDLNVSIGDASVVNLSVDGRDLGAMSKEAQTLRNISLDTAQLKKQYAR